MKMDRYEFSVYVLDILKECKSEEEINLRVENMIFDIKNLASGLIISQDLNENPKNDEKAQTCNDLILIRKSANQVGLYEKSTGKWLKWVGKKELVKLVDIDGVELKDSALK